MIGTKIEWATDTINAWWGCAKVSEACRFCYAETLDGRFHPGLPGVKNNTAHSLAAHWGADAPRLIKLDTALRDLRKIRRRAIRSFERPRVFVNSMSDFFEDRRDLDAPRLAMLDAMRQAPEVDFLLLTKRPEKIRELLSHSIMTRTLDRMASSGPYQAWMQGWLNGDAPRNIWLGTTVENQEWADKRIPELLKVPAAVRFLSCEPLLGPVDLGRWVASAEVPCKKCGHTFWLHDAEPCAHRETHGGWTLACPSCGHCRCKPKSRPQPEGEYSRGPLPKEKFISFPEEMIPKKVGRFDRIDQRFNIHSLIDWVICGGESGPSARPMHPDWARSLRDQCAAAGVAFHFKQWGEWAPATTLDGNFFHPHQNGQFQPRASGKDTFDWGDGYGSVRIGKKAAGRLLDGVEHNGFPEVR